MNKRIVPLLLSIVMMCSLLVSAVPAWAEPADSGVSASVTQASPGETFSVTLKVPGTAKPINEMSLKVHFNKAVFEVTEYTAPAITGMDLMQSNLSDANRNGFFSAGYTSKSDEADVELTGLELTAKFKVKDGAAAGEQQFTIGEDVSVGSLDSGLPDILMRKADFAKQFVAVKVVAAPKPATDISLSKSELTLTAGESASLTATVTPEGSTDTVVWSSSKTDVATVDATGKVTAVAPGEATITATAGTKTATCTVKVQAAPCDHGSCTPVPAKDSNCSEKGWDAYKKCDHCDKLFDMNNTPLAEIPYRALNDNAHDFNTSEWGYNDADGHAHVCRHNAAHHDEVRPHTPDHEGGATYDYAVKCTECGRVLEPQRVHGSIRVEVPFKLTVKKTGEMAPGQETFKFAVEKFGAPTTYTVVQDTVETNGEKTYEGKFIFTIRDDEAGNLSEGFVIRQVKGNAAGWTYDETMFYAVPLFVDSYESVGGWSFFKFDQNNGLDHNNPLREIGFTNSFNAKMPVTPPAPETPKTGDGSMMGLSIALVIVSGAALMGTALYSRRKSR